MLNLLWWNEKQVRYIPVEIAIFVLIFQSVLLYQRDF